MSAFPELLSVGDKGFIEEYPPQLYDGDPRGLVWMWEPPRPGYTYYMGIDPTQGRTGWIREARTEEDAKTDNGVISIFRKGKPGLPDVEVCQYAAPIDAFDLGYVANLLGRIYGKYEDEGQCKCILEVYPGPGPGTLQTMLTLGYSNFWRWEYYADSVVKPTQSIGWTANQKNNSNLWAKSSRLITLNRVTFKSPWTVDEHADLIIIAGKGWAEAAPGSHDDRVRASHLALWAANGWSTDIETTTETITTTTDQMDWQYTDMTLEEIMEGWANTMDRIQGN